MTDKSKITPICMKKIIKVCHFSSVHKDNDVRVFSKECLTLATAGYDTTLIACDSQQDSDQVRLIKIKDQGGRLRRIFFRSFRVYRAALSTKADIFHFHDPELLPYGLLIKLTTRAKTVYDSHECYPEDIRNKEWLPRPIRVPVARAYQLLEDLAVRRLDLVVAATPYIHKRFERIARRVVTVNNYPKREEFAIEASSDTASIRDGVCYVGAISEIRGILPFLDSLSYTQPSIKVYIAGSFANDAIKEAAFSHPNWRRVEYYGQVSRSQIRQIYKRSFAGIVNFLRAPNHEYSQPNKLFEYMAAGIPVIASDFALWKQIVEPTPCGITVQPDSALALANAINLLYEDRALAHAMGRSGVHAIATQYSWEQEGIKLINAYREICAT
jgi:glycosyltransferase involved in cell wall biosynthesis